MEEKRKERRKEGKREYRRAKGRRREGIIWIYSVPSTVDIAHHY